MWILFKEDLVLENDRGDVIRNLFYAAWIEKPSIDVVAELLNISPEESKEKLEVLLASNYMCIGKDWYIATDYKEGQIYNV